MRKKRALVAAVRSAFGLQTFRKGVHDRSFCRPTLRIPAVKLAHLTEVAALVAAHSRLILDRPVPLSTTVLGDFYIHSRNRFNRWLRALNDIGSGVEIRDPLHLTGLHPLRAPLQSITEQILINDLLNRVWTVVAVSGDRRRQEDRAETLVKNVFRGLQMIRSRALEMCGEQTLLDADTAVAVRQMARSAERWSDVLCCSLMASYDLWEYAWDRERAEDFCRQHFSAAGGTGSDSVWALILAGLRHSFPAADSLAAPLHDDDRSIVCVILEAFPPGAGQMSVWPDHPPASRAVP